MLADLTLSSQAEFHAALDGKQHQLKPTDPLWETVRENLHDPDFVLDEVVEIDDASAEALATANAADAAQVAEAMANHLVRGDWGYRNYDTANDHLDWIAAVLRGLLTAGRFDLFEDVAVAYVESVDHWNLPTTGASVDGFGGCRSPQGRRWRGPFDKPR